MSTPTSRDVYIETGQPHSPKAAPHHWLKNRLEKVGKVVFIVLWAFLLLCRYFPLTVLSITFTGKIRSHHLWNGAASQRKEEEQTPPLSRKPIYKKTRQSTEDVKRRIQMMGMVVTTRLGVVGIIWLAINLSIPSVRENAQVLGDPLWKWSVLFILIFLLIPSMLIVSYIIINMFLERSYHDNHLKLKLYWLKGVSRSIRQVLYFALILLIWILFFIIKPPPERTHNKIYEDIHKYIILTLLAFLLWAVIGLIGDILVLRWKSRNIYKRNKPRILVATFRLYLLHLLVGEIEKHVNSAAAGILLPYLDDFLDDRRKLGDCMHSAMAEEDLKVTSLGAPVRQPPIERFMNQMSWYVTLHDIHEAVKWFKNQNFDLSQDEIPDIRKLLPAIRKKYRSNWTQEMTADVIIAGLFPEDTFLRETLLKLLLVDLGKEEGEKISWRSIEDWMISAHRKCFAYMRKIDGDLHLANTLRGLLSAFQIVAALILWLFVTKLATTGLVITLGSLFAGLSFMFNDTCTNFVQAVTFLFYIHHFDVGDLVEINETKLEVQKIRILTTSFRILEKEKRDRIITYPNSRIAGENIITLKEEDDVISHKNDGDLSKFESGDETNKDEE